MRCFQRVRVVAMVSRLIVGRLQDAGDGNNGRIAVCEFPIANHEFGAGGLNEPLQAGLRVVRIEWQIDRAAFPDRQGSNDSDQSAARSHGHNVLLQDTALQKMGSQPIGVLINLRESIAVGAMHERDIGRFDFDVVAPMLDNGGPLVFDLGTTGKLHKAVALLRRQVANKGA